MLKKIGGLARAIYIVLAIVAGFVALNMMNVPLVLVVLGLIAGLAMPAERMVLVGVLILALPAVGGALGTLPAIGPQLTAVCANLQIGAAAALAVRIAIFLYEIFMDGVMGLTGNERTGAPAAATH